ncbi:hypothetical protein GCM10022600_13900 [Qipengyuania pelagi]
MVITTAMVSAVRTAADTVSFDRIVNRNGIAESKAKTAIMTSNFRRIGACSRNQVTIFEHPKSIGRAER